MSGTGILGSIRPGDNIFEREVIGERERFPVREVKATYRRRIVADVDIVDRSVRVKFENRLPASGDDLEALFTVNHDWRTYPPYSLPDFPRPHSDENDWVTTVWEVPRETPPDLTVENPRDTEQYDVTASSLEFHHVSGEGSQKFVNNLLAGGPDGRVDHSERGVSKWKAGFVATHNGYVYSVGVVGPPYNRSHNGSEYTITRLANHPHRPPSTSSWMIARMRDWVRNNTDVERLSALAGVDGNEGTCYRASGFKVAAGPKTVTSSGRDKYDTPRTPANHGEEWTKRRYVSPL